MARCQGVTFNTLRALLRICPENRDTPHHRKIVWNGGQRISVFVNPLRVLACGWFAGRKIVQCYAKAIHPTFLDGLKCAAPVVLRLAIRPQNSSVVFLSQSDKKMSANESTGPRFPGLQIAQSCSAVGPLFWRLCLAFVLCISRWVNHWAIVAARKLSLD